MLLSAQTYIPGPVIVNQQLPLSNAKSDVWIGNPDSVATDSAGNVYFTSLHCVFKLTPAGSLLRVAGNGLKGFSGDGGPASAARLFDPAGVAIDSTGALFIADSSNQRIRRVSPDGIITTIAGSGSEGFAGDNGPAVSAQLDTPVSIGVNAAGRIYILDFGNNRVRSVSPDGIITTVAGTGSFGSAGDGGPATAASLGYPTGLALNAQGDIYLADAGNNRVRRISNGIITTVAGNGDGGFSGDGGIATNATLSFPDGVRVDAAGNIYISDSVNFRIRKVATNGAISTVAGNGTPGFDGDNGAATDAMLNYPNDVAVDTQGNLFIADSANARIRTVSPSGRITTAAGGTALPLIESVDALAIGSGGVLYYADSSKHQVFSVATNGAVRLIAGDGTRGFSGDGHDAAAAQLNTPLGVAVDSNANVYIADAGNQRIRKVSASGIIATLAGSGIAGFIGDGGPALEAAFSFPAGLALDPAGNLYITDTGNQRIRRITPAGIVTTSAGDGIADYSGDGGLAVEAHLSGPASVAVDAGGNLLIADLGNGRIRRVTPAGVISSVASGLTSPAGVAADPTGNLFVADSFDHLIRRIASDGAITVIAGSGVEGYSGDAGPANIAQFSRPAALAVDGSGQIFVADAGNIAIRTLKPSAQSVIVAAVADAASENTGAIAPGKIVVLYGSGLGPGELATFPKTASTLPTELAGTVVSFNGVAAPVIYTSASQVAAIAPYSLTGSTAAVTVTYQGHTSVTISVPVSPTALGLFTANSTGSGQAAAINVSAGTLNTAAAPVRAGDYIALFATGEGITTSPADGKFASLPLPSPTAAITATVGGLPAAVQYAGGVYGTVAGLMQINVQVPAGIPASGYVPVTVRAGGAESPAGVWISVK